MDRSQEKSLENIEENSQDDIRSRQGEFKSLVGYDVGLNPPPELQLVGQDSKSGTPRIKEEDPISKQIRQEMESQLKEFQEQHKIDEGRIAIEKAQKLVDDIARQARKQGIGNEDDEKQKYYKELVRKKREYEDEYMKTNKEFNITKAMDVDKLQNFLVENFEQNLKQQRFQLEEEINERQEQADLAFAQNKKYFRKLFSLCLSLRQILLENQAQRLPQIGDIRSHYFKQSKEIFKPLKQIEIKQIHQEIKQKLKQYDVQEYMEKKASQKLEDDQFQAFYEWSKQQPGAEDQRNRVRELFVDCFELVSSLNNQPESMEKPLIWHSLEYSEQEKKIVDDWMAKKHLIKTNKYGFLEDEDEYEADDILKKVEKYFDTDLFLQQEDSDENLSDDELKGKKDKEPYNEATLNNYDQQQESESDA